MQEKRNFRKIVGIITLLVLLWATFFISRSLFETNDNNNRLYIPTNATMVLKLDGRQLIHQGFSDVILAKKDNDLLALILEARDDKNTTNTGINLLSDIYLFTSKDAGGNILIGLLTNLASSKKFKTEISKLLEGNQSFGVINNVGLILTDPSGELTKEQLKTAAKKMLKQEASFDLTKLVSSEQHPEFIQLWAAELTFPNEGLTLSDVSISVNIHSDSLSIHGTSSHSSNLDKQASWVSNDSYFYLESFIIPDVVDGLLKDLLLSIGLQVPSISHFALNHHYTEHSDEGNTVLIPHFDTSITFKDSLDIKSQLGLSLEKKLITSLTDTAFKFGGKQFYFKQISPLEVYLGRNKPVKNGESAGVLFAISGSPKPLSEFRGDGLIIKMLKLSNVYIASDQLFQRIDNMDVSVRLTDKSSCALDGEISFTEGNNPIDAVLNFLLLSGLK